MPHEGLQQAIDGLLMDIRDHDIPFLARLPVILVVVDINPLLDVIRARDTSAKHPRRHVNGGIPRDEPFLLRHAELVLIRNIRSLHTLGVLGEQRNIRILEHLLDRRLEAPSTARCGIAAEHTMGVHLRQDAPREAHDHGGEAVVGCVPTRIGSWANGVQYDDALVSIESCVEAII